LELPVDGEQIKPGLYSEVSNETYHSGPGISKSHLDEICPPKKSPRHYWAKYIDPKRLAKEDTEALRLGKAIHFAILEPDLFSAQYAQAPAVDRRTREGKAAFAEFELSAAGKEILTADDYAMVSQVRDAVHTHPHIKGLLRGGHAEQTFYAIDEETGELVKCRPDYRHDTGMVIDVKSAAVANSDDFGHSVRKYRYHVQDAWYSDVIRRAVGEGPEYFAFIAIEKDWPHAAGLYYVEPEDVERGQRLARRDLRLIHQHKAKNYWPDFARQPLPVSFPMWARRQEEAELLGQE